MQPPQPSVDQHHVPVGEYIAPTDFNDLPLAFRGVERRDQVAQGIINGDRLGPRIDPAGADHDREALRQTADPLERPAAGPNEDAGPNLGDGPARLAQGSSSFLAGT